jgi:hypothetical protein
LASGSSELSRNVSKAIISHVMKKLKLLWQNGFREQPEDFYSDPFETRLLALAALYSTRSRLRGEMKYGNKVYIPIYTLFFLSF